MSSAGQCRPLPSRLRAPGGGPRARARRDLRDPDLLGGRRGARLPRAGRATRGARGAGARAAGRGDEGGGAAHERRCAASSRSSRRPRWIPIVHADPRARISRRSRRLGRGRHRRGAARGGRAESRGQSPCGIEAADGGPRPRLLAEGLLQTGPPARRSTWGRLQSAAHPRVMRPPRGGLARLARGAVPRNPARLGHQRRRAHRPGRGADALGRGMEIAPEKLRADGSGRASFQVKALGHHVDLTVEARAGARAGALGGHAARGAGRDAGSILRPRRARYRWSPPRRGGAPTCRSGPRTAAPRARSCRSPATTSASTAARRCSRCRRRRDRPGHGRGRREGGRQRDGGLAAPPRGQGAAPGCPFC